MDLGFIYTALFVVVDSEIRDTPCLVSDACVFDARALCTAHFVLDATFGTWPPNFIRLLRARMW